MHAVSYGAVQVLGGPRALQEDDPNMEPQQLERLQEIRERVEALGGYL
ncbi:MAG TPA: hypothetical protein VK929_05825 [Longimicrobiales bacterium]|nr:hypothetical protein [Longimicrobiales bacterium]